MGEGRNKWKNEWMNVPMIVTMAPTCPVPLAHPTYDKSPNDVLRRCRQRLGRGLFILVEGVTGKSPSWWVREGQPQATADFPQVCCRWSIHHHLIETVEVTLASNNFQGASLQKCTGVTSPYVQYRIGHLHPGLLRTLPDSKPDDTAWGMKPPAWWSCALWGTNLVQEEWKFLL